MAELSSKNNNNHDLENMLWQAADKIRSNMDAENSNILSWGYYF